MIAASSPCSAQLVTFGALGGVPFPDRTVTHDNPLYHDESRPYLIGPSIEVRLPANFAIEADGIYQRIGNSLSYQLNVPSAAANQLVSSLLLRTRGSRQVLFPAARLGMASLRRHRLGVSDGLAASGRQ